MLDGHAMLLVGNRYNHTFVLMNLVLCTYNNYNETRNYYICLLYVLVYQQALENSADGYAMLLVGSRYNRTLICTNEFHLVYMQHNMTQHCTAH